MNLPKKKIIAIFCNTSWYIYNFRSNLIKALLKQNYLIITIAPNDIYTKKLIEIGCIHYNLEVDSKSKNPFKDVILFCNLLLLLNKIKPNILLNYTAKPNIYGAFAARINGIPCVNNIAGLGLGFVFENFTTKILRKLYKYSQRKAEMVFFQNTEDFNEFKKIGAVTVKNSDLLPGSGVDLRKFKYSPLTKKKLDPFIFIFIGRILYSKGVKLLYEASKKIHESNKLFKVILIGEINNNNNDDGVSVSQITNWNKKSFFEYIGKKDNVFDMIKVSHCVILPSYYREGTPRSLLEGLAVGRPVITTDMPGCKTTVIDDYNGYLIKPNDVNDLTEKMIKMLNLSNEELNTLCENSRQLAEKKFNEKIVINKYLKAIKNLL